MGKKKLRGVKNFEECKSYRGEALMGRYMCSSVKAVAEEAAMTRNSMAFSSSSSSLSSQSSRPPAAAQQNNQMGGVLKRKKANIRILVDGDEKVVSPYFSLSADAIVLDPRPQSSKRRAKDEGHIQSHPSDNVHKRDKSTSDEMLMEKNLNYTRDKSSPALSFQSSRSPAAQQNNQMEDVLKRKKANIRILLDGDEKVVSPYFALPPNAIVLDPSPQSSSKGRANDNMSTLDDEMLMEKNLNYNSLKKKKKKKSIILSAAEKKLDIYKRVSPDNTWVAPRSPHQLLQEEHCHDPWRVLITCMLLNRTRGEQVKASGVLSELFNMCPDAEAATKVEEKDLRELLRPLGLQEKKAVDIKKLSSMYLGSRWTHVTDLHGVGKYAADAYAIFCVGKPEEVTPLDHKLIDYWKFVCNK